MAIVTLVGGTVGGYITFAGGHRLLDAGIKGKAAIPEVTRGSSIRYYDCFDHSNFSIFSDIRCVESRVKTES